MQKTIALMIIIEKVGVMAFYQPNSNSEKYNIVNISKFVRFIR
jgi:hypothetical protein